jgi:hypothetical protein
LVDGYLPVAGDRILHADGRLISRPAYRDSAK